MTAPCGPGCGHAGPGASSFALYDALDLCAAAIDEAGSGRPHLARAAWAKARDAASHVTASPELTQALGLVLADAAPSLHAAEWRPALWRCLDAASLAILLAADGDRDAAGDMLLVASGHAAGLPCAPALRVALTAAWDQAREQVTA